MFSPKHVGPVSKMFLPRRAESHFYLSAPAAATRAFMIRRHGCFDGAGNDDGVGEVRGLKALLR